MFFISAQIPQLGNASDRLWSKGEEISIGQAAYYRLLKQGNIYESAIDLDYLNYLGGKIANFAETRLGLTFYLTKSRSINAFASPGGYVGINAGLILSTDNEHELAGVLGHEIAHVAQEHIAQSILSAKKRKMANTAAMIGSILMASQGSSKAGIASIYALRAGEKQSVINDIRRHEIEADRVGQRLMEKAGFNKLGMQTFFGKLYTPGALQNAPSYLLTHPLPQRRQAALDALKIRSRVLRSRNEYYLFRARIRADFLPKEDIEHLIARESVDPNFQIREASTYLSAMYAMRLGKIDEALTQLETLSVSWRENRDVQLLRAKLYLLTDHLNKSEKIYQTLWGRYQGDNVVAYDYGQFLLLKGEFDKAASILSRQIDTTLNSQMYWLYGEVLGKLGRILEQQKILIRYYKQTAQYERALAQVEIVSQRADLDWQTKAGFEAEKKELQSIIKRLKEFE